jgi:hypothetical protein
MLKKQIKRIGVLSGLLIFFNFTNLKSQETARTSTPLIAILQNLESAYNIKFSYVDEAIRGIELSIPEKQSLQEVLSFITQKTQIKVEKLDDRYYTLTQSTTIDICGIVLDNFEQNTVTGASVQILGSELAVITDFDGGFSFNNVPRDATLQIKHIGFKTLFVDAEELIDRSNCKQLLLGKFYQQLEEVVVYEFLTKGLVKQLDASIELNTEQFGILPGLSEPDILQTVQALPGIKSIDETVSDINIRGGSNDQNLILWDDIKMYQSGHFFGLISAFNPYLTDKVSLIKNGTSAKHGDGVSGLIDMRTKNKLKTEFFGGAGFNLISGDVYGQLSLGNKLAFQFSARRSTTDFFNSPTFDTFFNRAFKSNKVAGADEMTDLERNDRFYFYDFTGKLLYDINDNHQLRIGFININNLLDYTETNADENLTTSSALDQTNFSYGSTLTSQWSESFSSTINGYYTLYNLDATNTSSLGQQELFQNNRVKETSAKLITTYQLNDELDWINGCQITQTGIINETRINQPAVTIDVIDIVNTNALFSEFKYETEDKSLFAQVGVRLNHLKNPESFEESTTLPVFLKPGSFEEFIIEPRLNINYALTKELRAVLLGEFKSQATNQIVDLEQNFLGIEKRRWIVSDGANLPITRSKQGSLGLNYESQNLYVGIEGFYKLVNGINTKTQGFQNQNQFSINGEIGKYDVKGLEFLINKKSEDYSFWASYTYNFNNYTFDGETPPRFPNNLDIRHSATLAGTYTWNSLRLGVGLNYRSGKPFTEPEGVNTLLFPALIIYQETNSSRLPEYLRADASVIYDFELGNKLKATIGASVLNFTNRKNVLNIFYRLDENDNIEKVESTSLGMTPNFSFRLKF